MLDFELNVRFGFAFFLVLLFGFAFFGFWFAFLHLPEQSYLCVDNMDYC